MREHTFFRWICYDALAYMLIMLLISIFVSVSFTTAFVSFAIWQGLKLVFCSHVTTYGDWTIFNMRLPGSR